MFLEIYSDNFYYFNLYTKDLFRSLFGEYEVREIIQVSRVFFLLCVYIELVTNVSKTSGVHHSLLFYSTLLSHPVGR
jgi:hypothetical protein